MNCPAVTLTIAVSPTPVVTIERNAPGLHTKRTFFALAGRQKPPAEAAVVARVATPVDVRKKSPKQLFVERFESSTPCIALPVDADTPADPAVVSEMRSVCTGLNVYAAMG